MRWLVVVLLAGCESYAGSGCFVRISDCRRCSHWERNGERVGFDAAVARDPPAATFDAAAERARIAGLVLLPTGLAGFEAGAFTGVFSVGSHRSDLAAAAFSEAAVGLGLFAAAIGLFARYDKLRSLAAARYAYDGCP